MKELTTNNYTTNALTYDTISDSFLNKIFNPRKLEDKPMKKSDNYIFKGKVDFYQLCNDCIKDNRKTFILINDDYTYFGIFNQELKTDIDVICKNINIESSFSTGVFIIMKTKKENTKEVIESVKQIARNIRNRITNRNREICKRRKNKNNTTKQESKVLVF